MNLLRTDSGDEQDVREIVGTRMINVLLEHLPFVNLRRQAEACEAAANHQNLRNLDHGLSDEPTTISIRLNQFERQVQGAPRFLHGIGFDRPHQVKSDRPHQCEADQRGARRRA